MTGEETKNWTFHHLGVIVADMEKAVEYYKSLGIVDFPPETPRPANPPTWQEFTVYGETFIKDGEPVTVLSGPFTMISWTTSGRVLNIGHTVFHRKTLK